MEPFVSQQQYEEYIQQLRCGYRFAPTDEELLDRFLRCRIEQPNVLMPDFLETNVYENLPDQIKGKTGFLLVSLWYLASGQVS